MFNKKDEKEVEAEAPKKVKKAEKKEDSSGKSQVEQSNDARSKGDPNIA